jgi:hypothetical protein
VVQFQLETSGRPQVLAAIGFGLTPRRHGKMIPAILSQIERAFKRVVAIRSIHNTSESFNLRIKARLFLAGTSFD